MSDLRRLLHTAAPRPGQPFDEQRAARRAAQRRQRRRLAVTGGALALVLGVSGLAIGKALDDDSTVRVVTEPPEEGTGVTGGSSPSSTASTGPGPSAPPAALVGVEGGRLATFDPYTGARGQFLTGPQPGGGDSEPVVAGSTVWFVRGAGTCSSGIWSVGLYGEPATEVVPATDGDDHDLAVSADGTRLAWVHTPCQGEAVLKILDVRSGETKVFPMGNPLQAQEKPAWAPDNRHLAYFYKGGGGAPYGVHVLDTATAHHADEGKALTAGRCYQEHPGYLPDGRLVVLTCRPGQEEGVVVALYDPVTGDRLGQLLDLGVQSTADVAAFDLSADGEHAVYEVRSQDADGPSEAWRWDGGDPVALGRTITSPNW